MKIQITFESVDELLRHLEALKKAGLRGFASKDAYVVVKIGWEIVKYRREK